MAPAPERPRRRAAAEDDGGILPILSNKKAWHLYAVLEKLECGIVLSGTEVKSLREKNVSFADAWAVIKNGELVLMGLNIAEYKMGNRMNHPPARERRLLAHKREIRKLAARVREKGLTLIPLSLYWRRGKAKVELGVARGKAEFDKRETLKKREFERDKARLMRMRR